MALPLLAVSTCLDVHKCLHHLSIAHDASKTRLSQDMRSYPGPGANPAQRQWQSAQQAAHPQPCQAPQPWQAGQRNTYPRATVAHAQAASAGVRRSAHQAQTPLVQTPPPMRSCQPVQQHARSQATTRQGQDPRCADAGSEVVLLSADTCATEEENALYMIEFLNCLDPPGLPPHELRLRVGMPVVLLKDLNPVRGQAKGTRLIVKRASTFVLDAEIASGSHVGDRVLIPRVTMTNSDAGMQLKRLQFPVCPA